MFFMCLSLGMAGMFASCTSDSNEPDTNGKKGLLTLDLCSGVDFAETRAVDEASYQVYDDYNVTITNPKGKTEFSGTYSTLQSRMPMELDLGSYTIEASYGQDLAASRDNFKVEGENTFSIVAGQTVSTSVTCSPTCGKVSAVFDSQMATYYSQYYLAFSGTKAMGSNSAAWGAEDSAPYYISLEPAGETVTYTISLLAKDDYATQLDDGTKVTEGVVTGTFKLQRNKAYKLNISPNYTPSSEGGLSIVIVIDEGTNDKTINIEVPITWI